MLLTSSISLTERLMQIGRSNFDRLGRATLSAEAILIELGRATLSASYQFHASHLEEAISMG